MTAGRAVLARINERLDETDTGTVLICVVAFLAAVTAALIWGSDRIIDVILAAGIAAVAWYAGAVRARADQASDGADLARGKAEKASDVAYQAHIRLGAVEHHLASTDTGGTGRHASPSTGPSPYPRRPIPAFIHTDVWDSKEPE